MQSSGLDDDAVDVHVVDMEEGRASIQQDAAPKKNAQPSSSSSSSGKKQGGASYTPPPIQRDGLTSEEAERRWSVF